MAQAISEIFERQEKKYLLGRTQLRHIKSAFEGHLEVDEYGRTGIYSLYLDTPTYDLANHSLEKPSFKEKLRVRCYGDPEPDSTVFVEIKRKFRGTVFKRRIMMSLSAASAWLSGVGYLDAVSLFPLADDELASRAYSGLNRQIAEEVEYMLGFYEDLAPRMLIVSERTAWRGVEDGTLRATFDERVTWRSATSLLDGDAGAVDLLEPGECLMELKCLDAYPRWLVDALEDSRIYPRSFSKYGSAYLDFEESHIASLLDEGMATMCRSDESRMAVPHLVGVSLEGRW